MSALFIILCSVILFSHIVVSNTIFLAANFLFGVVVVNADACLGEKKWKHWSYDCVRACCCWLIASVYTQQMHFLHSNTEPSSLFTFHMVFLICSFVVWTFEYAPSFRVNLPIYLSNLVQLTKKTISIVTVCLARPLDSWRISTGNFEYFFKAETLSLWQLEYHQFIILFSAGIVILPYVICLGIFYFIW